MKVILVKDIDKLGSLGDEVVVKDGYARNYLIPGKIAVESSRGALRVIEQKKREKVRREEQMKEESREIAKKIDAVSCTISVETGEKDKLFGAVTPEMIAEALKAEGIEVDRRKIVLEEPIKVLGVYNVEVRVHPEVRAQARIWVVKK